MAKDLKMSTDSHPELLLDPDAPQVHADKWPPHFQIVLVLCVFIGGCAGAYARYLIAQALPTSQNGWPIATLTVNLLGSFMLGLLLEGLARVGKDQGVVRMTRLLIGTGFIGAFTTYSTFALEINSFLSTGKSVEALGYAAASLVGGVVLSGLGIQIASWHHRRREVRV